MPTVTKTDLKLYMCFTVNADIIRYKAVLKRKPKSDISVHAVNLMTEIMGNNGLRFSLSLNDNHTRVTMSATGFVHILFHLKQIT